jgi:hypothetical protein
MSGIAGPLIGAAGSLLGGLFGGGNPGYKYPGVGKFTHNQLRAYRKYGEKFGFHPLELLRSGAGLLGGGGGSGATSGVATQAAIAGTFDAIDDVLTGRSAKEEARQEVEDEIRRIDLKTKQAQLDRMTATGGGAFKTAAFPNVFGQPRGAKPPISSPGPLMAAGGNGQYMGGGGKLTFGLIGAPSPADDVELKPATHTIVHPDGGRDGWLRHSNPWRGDGGAYSERYGDAEIFQNIYAGYAHLDDFRYNRALELLAYGNRSDVDTIHAEVAKDPDAHGGAWIMGEAIDSAGRRVFSDLGDYVVNSNPLPPSPSSGVPKPPRLTIWDTWLQQMEENWPTK